MTAEQLEELLKLREKGFRISLDNEEAVNIIKRVIAAEKLVEALGQVEIWGEQGSEVIPDVISYILSARTAYREASK